ncbi:MAG: hypothetical protein RIR26_1944 [Pseudomonadota bacterium]|jgi:hypothetical protein
MSEKKTYLSFGYSSQHEDGVQMGSCPKEEKPSAFTSFRAFLRVLILGSVAFLGNAGCRARELAERQQHSMERVNFIETQEALQAKYESYCGSLKSRPVKWCLKSADAHVAWASHLTDEFLPLLKKSCNFGREVDCRKARRILNVSLSNQNVWKSDFRNVPVSNAGLRIKFLDEGRTASGWQDLAVEGAVFGRDSPFDFVCGRLHEIPETLVCVTKGNRTINTAIGRVVAYVEQGNQIRSVESHSRDPFQKFWQGVDLRREDYVKAVDLLREAGTLDPLEVELWKWLDQQDWKFFISFNSYSVFSGVPSHEFLHAAYFHSSAFRKISSYLTRFHFGFLNDVSRFVSTLYNTENPFIIVNEIQAHLLQSESAYQGLPHRMFREFAFMQTEWFVDSPRIRDLVKSPW